ncbi:hypothetical protein E2C01_069966 [Portunus trituberculatus]|uniref:Uncharacterized protein n=1 Tax=Portunus trituberculatus TaxID=210409 RepID=A0A5B7I0C7_PORTR|nr:hypothetical protein [Portunus trituberculatus]
MQENVILMAVAAQATTSEGGMGTPGSLCLQPQVWTFDYQSRTPSSICTSSASTASTGSSTSSSGTTLSTEECVNGSGAPTYQPAAELSGAQFEIASGTQFENVVGPNRV